MQPGSFLKPSPSFCGSPAAVAPASWASSRASSSSPPSVATEDEPEAAADEEGAEEVQKRLAGLALASGDQRLSYEI